MNYKHLFWIIPLSIFIGMVMYSMLTQETSQQLMNLVISCIEESNWIK